MKKQLFKLSGKKGFTLIELIVVIAILGILAAILIPQFVGFQNNARNKTAISEGTSVATAIDAYYADHNTYTTTAADLDLKDSFTSGDKLTLEDDGGFTYTSDDGISVGRADAEASVDLTAAASTPSVA